MNHDCNGDIFGRWGKTWGRCLGDGSFFTWEDGIEFCPNCKRPWRGISVDETDPDRRHSYDPDEDNDVLLQIDLPHFKRLAEERERKIAYLGEKLAWNYYVAFALVFAAVVMVFYRQPAGGA